MSASGEMDRPFGTAIGVSKSCSDSFSVVKSGNDFGDRRISLDTWEARIYSKAPKLRLQEELFPYKFSMYDTV